MGRHFECTADGSSKFWDIALEEGASEFTVRYGKIGTTGTISTKKFESPEQARKAADKLIAEKTAKGYAEAGGAAPAKGAVQSTATPVKDPAKATAKPKAISLKAACRVLGLTIKGGEIVDDGDEVAISLGNVPGDAIFHYKGDVRVDGDFIVEEGTAVIIEGDLTAGGDVRQCGNSVLVVPGATRARNLFSGWSAKLGEVSLTGYLYGNSYCDATLAASGVVTARAIIDDGHSFDLGTVLALTISMMNHGFTLPDYDQEHLAEAFTPELVNEDGEVDSGRLLAAIADGRDILLPTARKREQRIMDALQESIRSGRAVATVDMSGIGLRALPSWFAKLTGVTTLDLSLNRFADLPTEILAMGSLASLDLHGNSELEFPPTALAGLRSLTQLNVRGTKLEGTIAHVAQLRSSLPNCTVLSEVKPGEGPVSMRRSFAKTTPKGRQLWEIAIDDATIVERSGAAGGKQATHERTLFSVNYALEQYAEKVEERLKAGFIEEPGWAPGITRQSVLDFIDGLCARRLDRLAYPYLERLIAADPKDLRASYHYFLLLSNEHDNAIYEVDLPRLQGLESAVAALTAGADDDQGVTGKLRRRAQAFLRIHRARLIMRNGELGRLDEAIDLLERAYTVRSEDWVKAYLDEAKAARAIWAGFQQDPAAFLPVAQAVVDDPNEIDELNHTILASAAYADWIARLRKGLHVEGKILSKFESSWDQQEIGLQYANSRVNRLKTLVCAAKQAGQHKAVIRRLKELIDDLQDGVFDDQDKAEMLQQCLAETQSA